MNPYWKDGGTGLPEENKDGDSETGAHQDAEWLKKALKRAKEQAKNENIPLETVVAERYGVSLLEELLGQVFDRKPKPSLLISTHFGQF